MAQTRKNRKSKSRRGGRRSTSAGRMKDKEQDRGIEEAR